MATTQSGAEGGLHVGLHPLPILNISEHLTRVSLQKKDPNVRIVGGLLGTQEGRDIEIMNTFELVIEETDGKTLIDFGYFVTRKDQFKQVFPTFDFLGWYSVGAVPTPEDMAIHKQFFEYNETPLFLQLSAATDLTAELPVTIYESSVEIINNEAEVVFIKAEYEIESGEAERVAVDYASKPSTTGTGAQSGLIANLTTQQNAIKMLCDRVGVIVEYLRAVADGSVEKDQETLRQISALLTSLPAVDSKDFREEFMTEYNNVLLTTYLATITKQLNSANELLDKQLLLTAVTSNPSGGGGRSNRRGAKSDNYY